MKQRLVQLKARYQGYSPRERNLFKLCAVALCCAVVYYGAMTPLDAMIKNSTSTLTNQQQTLVWMRAEINKNHLQSRVVKASNPRGVLEDSAKEIHLPLENIQQDGQSLSFNLAKINVYELRNWLREVNLTTGIRIEKLDLVPVDYRNDVKARVKLSWAKAS